MRWRGTPRRSAVEDRGAKPHWLTLKPMGFRSQWRRAPAVAVRTAAVRTAADVTAIFYLLIHLRLELSQERTYTASVRAHEKIGIWRAIAKEVRTLGVHHRRGTHCRKRWEDIRRGTKKTAESLLGMASQRRRGACRQLTPLMFRILAVAYPDLDGRVRAAQQTQGGEYKHNLLCCRAVEVSGWGRRAVGPPRPGRYL
ncbi:hypothetical protein NDU88_003721 [Pleurodeles waltl]|uniref:Myb/SANT-like DNA-binding domain-containing protein n=1 Tax=Pleurodeles waltl TaxID=8319 RepID=A0AAV7UF53_PLEWA|nr:hypothetical protein NDU88_003721 [Pleurodeles waltl]